MQTLHEILEIIWQSLQRKSPVDHGLAGGRRGNPRATSQGPAGAGDLYVSALGGRNSKMGSFLGQGYLYKKIITSQMKGITIEGAELMLDVGSELLRIVGQKKLPLAALLLKVITKNKKLVIDWKKFIN